MSSTTAFHGATNRPTMTSNARPVLLDKWYEVEHCDQYASAAA